ncbi:competence protein CoiA family protein [Aurantimonas coralicida]
MGCCGARAVLKTSLYGVRFAAHYSNECVAAPETIWHVAAKDTVLGALVALGIPARQEVLGGTGQARWIADVLAEVGTRKIAFELQRSYLHFRDFERRQKRYRLDGVECFWLLQEQVAQPLIKAIIRKRMKEEFGGKLPEGSFYPVLPSLHWMVLRPDEHRPVWGPGPTRLTVAEWVASIVQNRLVFDPFDNRGRWTVTG